MTYLLTHKPPYPVLSSNKRAYLPGLYGSCYEMNQMHQQMLYLPGQKEQETRRGYLANGIPMTTERIDMLKTIAAEVGVPFGIVPM